MFQLFTNTNNKNLTPTPVDRSNQLTTKQSATLSPIPVDIHENMNEYYRVMKHYFPQYEELSLPKQPHEQGLIFTGTLSQLRNYLRYYKFPLNNGGLDSAFAMDMQNRHDEYLAEYRALPDSELRVSFTLWQFSEDDYTTSPNWTEQYTFKDIPFPEFMAYIKDSSFKISFEGEVGESLRSNLNVYNQPAKAIHAQLLKLQEDKASLIANQSESSNSFRIS